MYQKQYMDQLQAINLKYSTPVEEMEKIRSSITNLVTTDFPIDEITAKMYRFVLRSMYIDRKFSFMSLKT